MTATNMARPNLMPLLLVLCAVLKSIKCTEERSHWLDQAKADLNEALALELIQGRAKNVIIFIGDGMGVTTVTSARIYTKSESGFLAFEKFPHIGALKTYSADKLVPDSCSTATALFCGVKANQKTSGVDASVPFDDCDSSLNPHSRLPSIFDWAQKAGKATGFVTTTRVTHATPSALYAHTPNRDWECDSNIPDQSRHCKDIARQLVEDEPGRNINVIMGGGRQCMQSNVTGNSQNPVDTWACFSKDGRDLIEMWQLDKRQRDKTNAIVSNNQELNGLNAKDVEFVLGIFANGHLKMDYERDKGPHGMPSLSNMTTKAIEILANQKNGYILMVEGGLIDYGHHRGHARQALDETKAFNEAIEKALAQIDTSDTLVIVTSDHSHNLVMAGYADRTSSILDAAFKSEVDNIPYTSLLYGTGGPNNFHLYVNNDSVSRRDPTLNDTRDFEYSQQAAILTNEVSHSGTDVLVYAKGPMAHLFNRVHEQTYVAYVIAYATRIGPYETSDSRIVTRPSFIILCLISVSMFLKDS